VRDRAVALTDAWFGQIRAAVREAQAEGAIDTSEDPEQLAFELNAYLLLANAQFVISQERAPIDRASRALDGRLGAASDPRARR
jgi:hypothetical protein